MSSSGTQGRRRTLRVDAQRLQRHAVAVEQREVRRPVRGAHLVEARHGACAARQAPRSSSASAQQRAFHGAPPPPRSAARRSSPARTSPRRASAAARSGRGLFSRTRVLDHVPAARQVLEVAAEGLEAALLVGRPRRCPRAVSPRVAMAESRPRPEPSSVAPPGTGSLTTTQVMSVCASTSSRTRITSPRDQLRLVLLLDRADAARDRVAGAQRRLQRHRGQALHREPGLAGAFVRDAQRARPCRARAAAARPPSALRDQSMRLRRAAPVARRRCAPADRRRLELGRRTCRARASPTGWPWSSSQAPRCCRAEAADHQARQVVLPRRVVEHGQDQARRVGVGAVHQPPPEVVVLGAEAQRRAGVGEARAQDLLRLVAAAWPGRGCRSRGAGCDSQSITAAVGQRLRREVDRAEHAAAARGRGATALRARRACARRGPAARRPELALDAAFDEGRQAVEHARRAPLGRQLEAGLVRGREQVGGEAVAAARRRPRRAAGSSSPGRRCRGRSAARWPPRPTAPRRAGRRPCDVFCSRQLKG